MTKHGVLGSVVVMAVMFTVYLASRSFYLSPILNWGILLLYVPFMWWSLKQFGNENQQINDFRTLLRPPFLTFIIINLGFYLLQYSLFLYDKELLNLLTVKELSFLENELKIGTGDPQRSNQIREQINYLKQHGMQMPLGPTLLQMCMGAVGGFGLSALLVYIYRNSKR